MTISRKSDDEALIRNPETWVQYPFLPLVNRTYKSVEEILDKGWEVD